MRRALIIAVCLATPGATLLLAQDAPPAAPPATAPITLDVRATDPLGRPVTTLTAPDFVVEIDGLPRTVSSASYVSFGTPAPAPAAGGAVQATPESSSLPNNRAILAVVDDLSFDGPLPARLVDDLTRWVALLGPRDVVGFATTSGRIRTIAPSRDRAAVVNALQAGVQGRRRLAVDADRNAVDQVNALHELVRQLNRSAGSRVLLVFSNGIAGGVSAEHASALRRVANQAGVRVYALVRQGGTGAATSASPDGLVQLISGAGGRVARIGEIADAALADVIADVSGAYRLTVDVPSPPEGPYRLVKVTARDVATLIETASRLIAVASSVPAAAVEERVRTILRDGEPAFGVALESVGVIARDETPGQIRLLNTVTVPASAAAPVTMTFVVLDEQGAEVRGGTGRLGEPVAGEFRTSFAIALAPGRYRLRVAVADAGGRIGLAERSLLARLRTVGPYTAADPQIVWRAETAPWYLVSDQTVPAAARAMAVALELFAGADAPPPTIAFALVTPDGREVAQRDLTAAPMAGGWRVSSEVALDSLPPGTYDVVLAVKAGAADVVPVHAWVRRGGAAATAPLAPPSKDQFLSMFQSDIRTMWPRFNAGTTLTTGVARRLVAEFAEDARRPLPAGLAASLSNERWVAGLTAAAAQTDVFGAVARAILSLVKGELATAETALGEARKAVPNSTPLEILGGAAHAAAGRDREAIAVWRDAIGGLAADPDWSLPLADALGRSGDYAGALEALSLLPRDPSRLEAVRSIDAAIVLGRFDQARAAAEKGRTGTGTYQGRLAFYALVFAYADALAPNATDATKRAFIEAGEAYVTTGGELSPLVKNWVSSLAK